MIGFICCPTVARDTSNPVLIFGKKFVCVYNKNNNNLSIEIQRMWNMKCFVIPVIIGATGIVSKRSKIWKQYQDNIH
jgi:hypothetical protein